MIYESKLIQLCRRNVELDVASLACLNFLDWLGCVIAARYSPAAHSIAKAFSGNQRDILDLAFAYPYHDAQTAAFTSGALGNVLEMDDLHRGSILHASNTVCPAALAVSIRQNSSGLDLLRAIVRGYEGATRIGVAAASGGYTSFYNSSTCGVFGAAIAAADIKKLDADGMADAIGQAGMQAAGIWQCRLEPTFSKQLACAHAARAGVLSADLAGAGFLGARQILTGPLGFFASYYPKSDLNDLTLETENGWWIKDISFKPFPACRHTHPAISAALELRPSIVPKEIRQIELHTYEAAVDFCDKPVPETADEARFSLQHTVATTLINGRPRIVDFNQPTLTNSDIQTLRPKIHLHIDPELDAAFPTNYGARLRVEMIDGSELSAHCPAAWGDPENPMSDVDLIAKFCTNAAYGGLTDAGVNSLLEAVLDLPNAADLTTLKGALTAALTPKPELASYAFQS